MSASDPSLEVAARLEGENLVIAPRVRNGGSVPLHVHCFESVFPDVRTGAHVFCGHDDTLLLFCGTLPPPPLVALAWPGRPATRRIEPGQTFEWDVVVGMPVLEHGPGQPPDPRAAAEDRWTTLLRVTVQAQPELAELTVHAHTATDTFDVWGPEPLALRAEAALPTLTRLQRRCGLFRPLG
jgi:hypothetical protein